MISELKERFRASGLSLYAMSRMAGGAVVAPELSRWLNGKSRLGEAKLDAVARVLGVRLDPRPVRVAKAKRALADAVSRVPADRNARLANELLGQS